MKFSSPNIYRLRLKPRQSYEVKLCEAPRVGFHNPDTLVCPKLYVVTKDGRFHYVGITNRPMAQRLNYGLKATGARGYHGYQWKRLKGELRMLVWSFPRNREEGFMRKIETVEAEVAYLVRKQTGTWPLSQTEIHFFRPSTAHRRAAEKVMKQCFTK